MSAFSQLVSLSVTVQPQLSVIWENYDNTPTIYITNSATLNDITVTLANGQNKPITFAAGSPVSLETLPTNQSAIYFAFSGLLSSAEISNIALAAAGDPGGWQAATYYDTQLEQQLLVIAPVTAVTLPVGGNLSFTLNNVLCADPVATGYVQLDLANAGGLSLPNPYQVEVQVANPPQAANKTLNLVVGFTGTNLVTTGGAANQLVLYLSNPNAAPLVPGGTESWVQTPTFQLSFLYAGTGASALTTVADGANISVNNGMMNGNDWLPAAPFNQSTYPYWVMQPNRSSVGGAVLGPANQLSSTVSFDITDIVTTLPAGTTLATLSYWYIPGYNDGQFSLQINKIDPISIATFSTSVTSPVPSGTASVSGNLKFSVNNASYVVVTNTSYAQAVTGSPFSGTIPIKPNGPIIYTLIATNFAAQQQTTASVEIDFTDSPYDALPQGAIIMWSGTAIPAGWAICDGGPAWTGVNTPNLVGQFILGADPNAATDGSGEGVNASGQPDAHTHNFSASVSAATTGNDGAHTHSFILATQQTTFSSGTTKTPYWVTTNNVTTGSSQGNHTHNFSVNIPTTATAAQNASAMRPAWYALYYIMKCY